MPLDIEEYRPEAPRVPTAISVREGVLLSLVFHLVLVVVYILSPRWAKAAPAVPVNPADQVLQFVDIAPRIDKSAIPKLLAPPSDLDRRSVTREVIPKATNDQPLAHGNTDEKVEGAPSEKMKGPESPNPATSAPPQPPLSVMSEVAPATSDATGGSLGQSLRNLQKYLRNETFDNPQGGQAQQGADIQFDSKGVDFDPWLRRFKAQVMSNWFPPQAAMLLKGHVVFQFFVHRDGSITDLKVVAPSTVDAFNSSAMTALKLSNPTAPLPSAYPTDSVLFTVTFHYNESIH